MNIKKQIIENQKMAKETLQLQRAKAKEHFALIKEQLFKEAKSLGCDVSDSDTKEKLRRAIYDAKKAKNLRLI